MLFGVTLDLLLGNLILDKSELLDSLSPSWVGAYQVTYTFKIPCWIIHFQKWRKSKTIGRNAGEIMLEKGEKGSSPRVPTKLKKKRESMCCLRW